MEKRDIREVVRSGYAKVACTQTNCCGTSDTESSSRKRAIELGYDSSDMEAIPDEANLGLGCGNPTAMGQISAGEVVLDLGSGAGMDAFLAAEKVGESGQVIGVDMTPEMLARARDLASAKGVSHFVEFRRGFIEELPVTDESVDVVLSNCVINLSVDKKGVFEEAYRVLKPGGRIAISDICLSEPLPEELQQLESAYVGCISGAMGAEDYHQLMTDAGFVEIEYTRTPADALFDGVFSDPILQEVLEGLSDESVARARDSVWSYNFSARKR